MDYTVIIELAKNFGLPLALLIVAVYYFFIKEKSHTAIISEKENLILKLNEEKIEILEKAINQYTDMDKSNFEALSKINTTLTELKSDLQILKLRT